MLSFIPVTASWVVIGESCNNRHVQYPAFLLTEQIDRTRYKVLIMFIKSCLSKLSAEKFSCYWSFSSRQDCFQGTFWNWNSINVLTHISEFVKLPKSKNEQKSPKRLKPTFRSRSESITTSWRFKDLKVHVFRISTLTNSSFWFKSSFNMAPGVELHSYFVWIYT